VGAPLPIADYGTDTKSVLDQALRVLNAMIDVAADEGLAEAAVGAMRALQCLVQAIMPDDHPLQQLPHLGSRASALAVATALGLDATPAASLLREIVALPTSRLRSALTGAGRLGSAASDEVMALLRLIPCSGRLRCRTFVRLSGGEEVELTSAFPTGADALVIRFSVPQPPQRRAYTPRLTGRSKDWGWWLAAVQTTETTPPPSSERGVAAVPACCMVSSLRSDTLLAIKRLGGGGEHALVLERTPGLDLTRVRMVLVSDCMRGLDAELCITVGAAS